MALFQNRLLTTIVILLVISTPVFAQDYNALSHSDGISLSAGDSSRANIAIQTPTPWPKYLNDFDYDMPGQQGVDLMTGYLNNSRPGSTTTKTSVFTGDGTVSTTLVK